MSLLAEWIDSVSSTLCRSISLSRHTYTVLLQTDGNIPLPDPAGPTPTFYSFFFFLYFPPSVAAVLAIPKLLYYALYKPICVCCSATMAPALVYY